MDGSDGVWSVSAIGTGAHFEGWRADGERDGRAKRYFRPTPKGLKEIRDTGRTLVKLRKNFPEHEGDKHEFDSSFNVEGLGYNRPRFSSTAG